MSRACLASPRTRVEEAAQLLSSGQHSSSVVCPSPSPGTDLYASVRVTKQSAAVRCTRYGSSRIATQRVGWFHLTCFWIQLNASSCCGPKHVVQHVWHSLSPSLPHSLSLSVFLSSSLALNYLCYSLLLLFIIIKSKTQLAWPRFAAGFAELKQTSAMLHTAPDPPTLLLPPLHRKLFAAAASCGHWRMIDRRLAWFCINKCAQVEGAKIVLNENSHNTHTHSTRTPALTPAHTPSVKMESLAFRFPFCVKQPAKSLFKN